jgi:dnd system-associated protein 4
MSSASSRRVRRPKDKEAVIQRLIDGTEGPFGEIRDVLTFAAAFGYAAGRRDPFESSGEAIRWETFKNRRGTEILVAMLALAGSEDPGVVSERRFEEQIRIFEEYANGGLTLLEEALEQSPQQARDAVLSLVQNELSADEPSEPDPLGLLA